MRQTLPSEGEDEDQIHYSIPIAHKHAHTHRASLFPHLHHGEEVRGCGRPPPTAPPFITQVVHVRSRSHAYEALHSSEDVIIDRLSPATTEGGCVGGIYSMHRVLFEVQIKWCLDTYEASYE